MDWAEINDRLWLLMMPATGVAYMLFMIAPRAPRGRVWRVAFLVAGSLFCLAGLLSFATTIVLLGPGKPLLDRIFEDVLTVAFAVLIAGLMLFWLRRTDRFAYGLVEIASALVVAGYTAWAPDGGPVARVLALLAATYIVVRGLDNMQTGYAANTGMAEMYRRWQTARAARLSRNSPGAGGPDEQNPKTVQSDGPPGPAAS